MEKWWKSYPQKHWAAVDWKRWEREGRPRVPRDIKLEQRGKPLTPTPPVVQPRYLAPAGFSLYAKSSKGRDARGKQVDKLLSSLRIR